MAMANYICKVVLADEIVKAEIKKKAVSEEKEEEKKSLLYRLEKHEQSIGASFLINQFANFKLHYWGLSNKERFKYLMKDYMQGASLVFFDKEREEIDSNLDEKLYNVLIDRSKEKPFILRQGKSILSQHPGFYSALFNACQRLAVDIEKQLYLPNESSLEYLRDSLEYFSKKKQEEFDKSFEEQLLEISIESVVHPRVLKERISFCADCGEDVSQAFEEKLKSFFCTECRASYVYDFPEGYKENDALKKSIFDLFQKYEKSLKVFLTSKEIAEELSKEKEVVVEKMVEMCEDGVLWPFMKSEYFSLSSDYSDLEKLL